MLGRSWTVQCWINGVCVSVMRVGSKSGQRWTRCWTSVKDGSPALIQHWLNVSCLYRYGRALNQHYANMSYRYSDHIHVQL